MTRIDVPTLQCDRCKMSTSTDTVMARFRTLARVHTKSESGPWDLCPTCWDDFGAFMRGRAIRERLGPNMRAHLAHTEAGIQHDGDLRCR